MLATLNQFNEGQGLLQKEMAVPLFLFVKK